MRRYDVPRVAFVNKLDRAGADPWKVLRQMREKLRLNVAAVQVRAVCSVQRCDDATGGDLVAGQCDRPLGSRSQRTFWGLRLGLLSGLRSGVGAWGAWHVMCGR